MVELRDDSPFGEKSARIVWLARVESVTVRAPDANAVSVELLMAFDTTTNNLVCAFTEPSSQWAYSALDPGDAESSAADAGWEVAPAKYESLKSTVPDVLAAVWKQFGVDPAKAGQVIVRPRFVANKFPTDEIDGRSVPRYPPTNVWIVEALGTVIMQRRIGGEDRDLTTLIVQFRDGDLASLPGMIRP
jgi:hypothetical protein